ncbi:MAG: UDP-N-acetylglucosamine 1-carboxyvinyltransferase [Actinobacteria bacterium]|nr:UDP-N-acetylglucosamine 1-carboxyvinyltransferase [Actinomycetota bacterium]
MEKFLIRGGRKLVGTVRVAGAKNAALKLMAASLLADGPIILTNVPKIKDVYTMASVLNRLGGLVDLDYRDQAVIDPSSYSGYEAPYELVSQMRASIIVLGPLLARAGRARVAMPGGCNIGSRKIDLHIRGLEALGADIEVDRGFIDAKARRLVGGPVKLDFPSVGATENVLMAAVLARGATAIENAAREPEIVDLATMLVEMGAKIEGIGTSTIQVEGVDRLSGVTHEVIPDRIEAGTLLTAAAITSGDVTVEGACLDHLEVVVAKLSDAGVKIQATPDGIRAVGRRPILPVDIATLPYPGFPTDMQAQIMALLSLAEGTSVITENIFENRFIVADEFVRMGCDVRIDGHHVVIRGVKAISGVPVKAPDLRGGAGLVLAGLVSDGVTEVSGIHHIDRGYEDLVGKLRAIGADIGRLPDINKVEALDSL